MTATAMAVAYAVVSMMMAGRQPVRKVFLRMVVLLVCCGAETSCAAFCAVECVYKLEQCGVAVADDELADDCALADAGDVFLFGVRGDVEDALDGAGVVRVYDADGVSV